MRLYSPGGWASLTSKQLAWFCLVFLTVINLCNAQSKSSENSAGKNHLNGIRRLSIQKVNGVHQILSNDTSDSKVKLSDLEEREHKTAWPAIGRYGSGSTRRRAPFAMAPILSRASAERLNYGNSRERELINYERRVNLLPIARGAPTHQISPSVRHRSLAPTYADRHTAEYRRLARWRKVGPLLRPGEMNFRYPYTKTRYVAHAQHASMTEATSTTSEPTAITQPIYTTTTLPEFSKIPPSRLILPDNSKETLKPLKLTTNAPIIRRIHVHSMPHADGIDSPLLAARQTYGQKQFFNGPILDDNFESRTTITPPRQTDHSQEEQNNGPIIMEDTSNVDYHSRQGSVTAAVKRFKFVNKLSHRPRLKIRRPEEQFVARSDGLAKSSNYPLTIPELTPLESRRPLPTFEEPGPFMIRHHGDHAATNLKPLPSPVLPVFGEQIIQIEPPSSPQSQKLPSITEWSNEEDFSETVTEANNGGDSGLVGIEDSGAGFGSGIKTPPSGFAEAFGLNGEGVSLETTMSPLTETITDLTTTTTRKPLPTPEEIFVVPENSGLRSVLPPSDLKGGFGSARGSSLSEFGSNGGSFDGFGVERDGDSPSLGFSPAPPVSNRGRMPGPKSTLTDESYFTGESALSPNRAGPNGDGYGPPVFPGGVAPPPIPAVNVGGGAANIPPYRIRNDDVENEATTVKPSVLLSMLNKADEGFNQAITHFEQGTPIEAAAIDILEVALGSTKLDSQAKLLSHVDRTIGLDNLQRLQRWANTGGAFDMVKEQFLKFAKNYKVPDLPPGLTIPPQLEYLFSPSG